jgi:ATP-binding cassette subfamily B protein
MMQGHGMRRLANAPDEIPEVTWDLLKRVLTYAKPYRVKLILLLLLIMVGIGLSLLSPLIVRELIDNAIPDKDMKRLILLASGLLALPAVTGVVNVIQRRLSAAVGEGVIYDLRLALYSGLQRMSLRFFTNTKVGELMSRLNNDVVGAQNAISSTLVDLITNIIQVIATLAVMVSLDWRMTLISVVIFPLFIIAVRKLSNRLRDIVRRQMVANAHMNAMMNETLNIGGALLVKLFGRQKLEVDRFGHRAG